METSCAIARSAGKCERGVDRPAHPRQINRQILKARAWMPYRRDVNREKEGRVHARRIRPSFDDHRRAGDGVYAKASFSASLALHFSSTIPKHLSCSSPQRVTRRPDRSRPHSEGTPVMSCQSPSLPTARRSLRAAVLTGPSSCGWEMHGNEVGEREIEAFSINLKLLVTL
jgi:hypothetical protein